MLAPVLASIVIAYLLGGIVELVERRRVHRMVVAVLLRFLTLLLLLLGLIPRISAHAAQRWRNFLPQAPWSRC